MVFLSLFFFFTPHDGTFLLFSILTEMCQSGSFGALLFTMQTIKPGKVRGAFGCYKLKKKKITE